MQVRGTSNLEVQSVAIKLHSRLGVVQPTSVLIDWYSPFAPASPTQAPDTIEEFLPRLLGVHIVSKHDTLIVADIA